MRRRESDLNKAIEYFNSIYTPLPLYSYNNNNRNNNINNKDKYDYDYNNNNYNQSHIGSGTSNTSLIKNSAKHIKIGYNDYQSINGGAKNIFK